VLGKNTPCKGTGKSAGVDTKDTRHVQAKTGRSVLTEKEKWKL
jgi:hypothetical protein